MSDGSTPAGTAPLELAPEDEHVAAIADLVAEHRIRHISLEELPENLQPESYDPIEKVMLAIHRRIPWKTAGWKVGAASVEVQRLERLPGPVPGRLYQHRFYKSGAEIPLGDFINHRNTECEFAFILEQDLPARDGGYSMEDLSAAVGDLIPVFEIGDSVFPNWYESSRYYGPCLDNGGGAAMVLGQPISDWRDRDLSQQTIDLYVNGEHRRSGRGEAAMGHPLRSLAWMATWTSSYGIDLKAGELLSSGTCTSHCFADPGDEVVADFAEFGTINVRYLESDEAPSRKT